MNIIFLLTLAYLIGSIPTAVWVSKRIYGLDIRDHGSGNAGATNTFRVLGKKAGIGVMLVDMLKGFAVSLKAKSIVGTSVTKRKSIILKDAQKDRRRARSAA